LDEYRRIDTDMSTYRPDSEISRVNTRAGVEPVVVGDELFALVESALQLSSASDGAFDITYESIGYLYDFRTGLHPSDVERGAAILKEAGIAHALLNAGGDTRVIGDRRGQPWIVGIRHPRAPDAVVTRLPLIDEAISTSGDYERFFEENGKRYHHILNPATGRSTEGVLSVTVIGPDATLTDGLSTTLFVLGPESGLQLIETFPEYEAIVVDAQGRLSYSSGLEPPPTAE
jgi:thiamine biosynthesis lipoprotein